MISNPSAIGRALAFAAVLVLAACSPKSGQSPAAGKPDAAMTVIRFATDWRAQAEQGGFYQAVATG